MPCADLDTSRTERSLQRPGIFFRDSADNDCGGFNLRNLHRKKLMHRRAEPLAAQLPCQYYFHHEDTAYAGQRSPLSCYDTRPFSIDGNLEQEPFVKTGSEASFCLCPHRAT